jgi:hypothetical protein
MTLQVGGAAEFIDMESGRRLQVQPSVAGDRYRAAVQQWLADVERRVRHEGLDYLRLVTDEPLEPALRRFLVRRRGGA